MSWQGTQNTRAFATKSKSKDTSTNATVMVEQIVVPEVKQALVGVLDYVEAW